MSLLQTNLLKQRRRRTRQELRLAVVVWIEQVPPAATPRRTRRVDPYRIRAKHHRYQGPAAHRLLGHARRTMCWKPALNAFAITFGDRTPKAQKY